MSQTVERLIGYISHKGYRVGERLPSIKELANEFDLGPHAVRDALLQAQMIGLVKVQPRSGAYVQSLNFSSHVDTVVRGLPQTLPAGDDASLLDVLEARRLIESELASIAAGRRRMADLVPIRDAIQEMYRNIEKYDEYVKQNEVFHLKVAELAGNKLLVATLKQLMGLLRAVLVERQPQNWNDVDSQKRAVDMAEHEAIFAALVAGDAAAAKSAMLVHLRDTTDSLIPPAQRPATAG